jgi:hypothetical protein
MKTDTETLANALDTLAHDIQSSDGVANAVIAEAAQRLRELKECGNMCYMCASQLGYTSSDDAKWIAKAEQATELWNTIP